MYGVALPPYQPTWQIYLEPKFVGGIHGRLLTAWASAGVFGPVAITSLREISVKNAINDLASKLDPLKFQTKSGADIEHLQTLIDVKTVTIAKLMEIVPTGTVNPTSSLYNTAMYLMAVVLFITLLTNAFMHPVDAKHHMKNMMIKETKLCQYL